jgi:hypothetical protein
VGAERLLGVQVNGSVCRELFIGHAFAAPEALIEDNTITMELLAVQRPSSHPHALASTIRHPGGASATDAASFSIYPTERRSVLGRRARHRKRAVVYYHT